MTGGWASDNNSSQVRQILPKLTAADTEETSPPGDVYAYFNPNNLKSADPITYADEGNVIPLSERFNPAKKDIRYSLSDGTSKITLGMTDSERAEILRNNTVTLQEINVDDIGNIDWIDLERNRKSTIEKPLIKKLRELGYLKAYQTENVDVEFEFTAGGLRKSMNSQVGDYGGSLADLTKVVMNMQALLDNSVLLEIHKDKAKGTPRENVRLVQTYVLLSAYREQNMVTPVQFEVKQYINDENRLYLAVALTKIETGVMDDTALRKEERTRLLPVSEYSISQLIEKINPRDENFFKYIPDEMLSGDQIKAKQRALDKEAKKYGRDTNTIRFSLTDRELRKKLADLFYGWRKATRSARG